MLDSSFATTKITTQFKRVLNFMEASHGPAQSRPGKTSPRLKPKPKRKAGMVREMDCKGDGYVDLEEFMNALDQTWFLGILTVGFIAGAFFVMTFLQTATTPIICKTVGMLAGNSSSARTRIQTQAQNQLVEAILHYATSRLTPQQNIREIRLSMEVLQKLGPSNFLVFGLGYDSLMWKTFNLGGTTLFLEDDLKFYNAIVGPNPNITAYLVKYSTKMSAAGELVQHSRDEPDCSAARSFLRGNLRCRLALHMLPDEVYDIEWDLIMIDGPNGYYSSAPGRMAAIYSAAVMARNRKRSGVTHVFLHDVHRKVEKVYAELFLCRKNLVDAVGNLWHFEIPPASLQLNTSFC